MVNICEESKLSLTIASNGSSSLEDNNFEQRGNHPEVMVDSGDAHLTLEVPMVDSIQAHHIHGEADSINARQTQGEDRAHPSLKPSNEASSDRRRSIGGGTACP